MAYDFPNTPTVGQVFQKWTWNGEAWVLTPPVGSAANVTFAPTGNIAATNVQAAIAEVDSEKVAKAGDTMGGQLTVINNALINSGGGVNSLEVKASGTLANAAITFHLPAVFAANFGMANDGNFYMGGYSFGAVTYKFWTTRDFATVPVLDVSNKVNKSGDSMTGDLTIWRAASPGTGVLALGNSGSRYLIYDGTRYTLNGAPLNVGYPAANTDAATAKWVQDQNYQPNLGFTPTQQGGGLYQAGNKVYIGWDGGGLRAQVDSSDQGKFVFESQGNAFISNGRLPYAGDVNTATGAQSSMVERIQNAVMSSWSWVSVSGVPVPGQFRLRYVQGYNLNSGWFTFAYA